MHEIPQPREFLYPILRRLVELDLETEVLVDEIARRLRD